MPAKSLSQQKKQLLLEEKTMPETTVTITDNRTGKSVELPIEDPTLGVSVVDISKLFKEMGYFTYDPGFVATASCKSAITYLD